MNWTERKFNRNEVDRAGDILISSGATTGAIELATNVLDNWRSSHSFALHIFKKRLKNVSYKVDKSALVVQRLKRNPSILKKLQRKYGGKEPTMKLSQMQDIGGCRAVLNDVIMARKLCDEYYHIDENTRGKHCDLKHEFKNKKDYITSPKEDGYRSIHLIYKYKSDKTIKNNGLLVEIQIRSKSQHIWATAVETVGHFTKQALKSNEGEEEWLSFFKLISTVFANKENTPIVPNTPKDPVELYRQVKNLSNRLQVIDKIEEMARLLNVIIMIDEKEQHKPHFYLLNLDLNTKQLLVSTFKKTQEEKANIAYSEAEKEAAGASSNKDVVLVEADTTRELKKAYPNYFLDTKEFIDILTNYLNNSPSTNQKNLT